MSKNKDPVPLEGIVLKVVPYKERDKIISLYTPTWGLVSAYVRGTKKEPLSWIQPITLMRGQVVVKEGLYSLSQAELANPYFAIRRELKRIETAAKLIALLQKCQLERDPHPPLYQLFTKMLLSLDEGFCPQMITTCFIIKLLFAEGLLNQEYKEEHFSDEEWQRLFFIVASRSLKEISALNSSEEWSHKVEELFYQLLN